MRGNYESLATVSRLLCDHSRCLSAAVAKQSLSSEIEAKESYSNPKIKIWTFTKPMKAALLIIDFSSIFFKITIKYPNNTFIANCTEFSFSKSTIFIRRINTNANMVQMNSKELVIVFKHGSLRLYVVTCLNGSPPQLSIFYYTIIIINIGGDILCLPVCLYICLSVRLIARNKIL